jgi:hypothetical protein
MKEDASWFPWMCRPNDGAERRLFASAIDDSSISVIRRQLISDLPSLALTVKPLVFLYPPPSVAESYNSRVQGPTNKRIGGLASKIRSVCNVMVREGMANAPLMLF